ncbi:MAG: DUF2254 domain-containing protein [Casimicrobiaceae bacterium]
MHRLQSIWINLRSSLWFVPAIMVTALVVLAVILIEVDTTIPAELLQNWPRLFGAQAEGTRGMLSAVAGAMITVAGVVFSITIVALSLTSSQYTSRVLRNFMRDRSNQIVLGAFVGIYAYCLVVLRTIRGGDEAPFVPSLATLGAMVLAFVGIALLIHFIHHISMSIQAAQILAAIREDTVGPIERLFPDDLGEGDDDADDDPDAAATERRASWCPITAPATGYVQAVDAEAVMQVACAHDRIIRLPHDIGAFVVEDSTLVELDGEGALPEDAIDALKGSITVGHQRTVEQDPAFGIRQIVDIALKALSPGVNDPTTATMCLDQLCALLMRLVGRKMPSRYRYMDGRLRVITKAPTYASFLAGGIEEIRQAAAKQPIVLARLVGLLRELSSATRSRTRRRLSVEHAGRIAVAAAELTDVHARAMLESQLHEMLAGLQQVESRPKPTRSAAAEEATDDAPSVKGG